MDNSELIPHDPVLQKSGSEPVCKGPVLETPDLDAPDPDAPLRLAVINVRNLRLRTYIGFNPEEKCKRQDVVINIEVAYQPGVGIVHDHIDDALNYKLITKRVIELVENGRFLLLERLTADILATCSDDRRVRRARVCVDKPHALRFAESVSVTLEYHAGQPDSSREEK